MEQLNDLLRLDPTAKTKHLKKGQILQHAGDVSVQTYFVKRGLLRSYLIDSKGKQHIFSFAPEGWVIADVESLEFHQPVELFIDCLEESEVVIFDRDCLFRADLDKETLVHNARLLYRRMGVLQRRVLMLMSAPAIDRYTYFVETYPNLLHRIPNT